jgi:hypothetical protein
LNTMVFLVGRSWFPADIAQLRHTCRWAGVFFSSLFISLAAPC